MSNKELSRRDFLNIAALSMGAISLRGIPKELLQSNLVPSTTENITNKKEGMEIINTIKYEGLIRAYSLPLIFVPLRDDYFYDKKREIESWEVKNIHLGINRIIHFKQEDGRVIRVATLHHTTGDHSLPIAVLDEGVYDELHCEYRPLKRYAAVLPKGENIAEFSLIGDYYANKTHNLMESAAQLLRYQIKNGPFVKDETYSALDIFNIRGNPNYKMGTENNKGYGVKADGVCGMATLLAHTLSQAHVRFNEHYGHSYWSQYWTGPLDTKTSVLNDTAISDMDIRHDFKWTPLLEKSHYLSVESILALNGPPTWNTSEDVNTRVFFQLMLTEKKPDLEKELVTIEQLQNDYENYNQKLGASILLERNRLVGKQSWDTNTTQEAIIRAAYVEENVEGFEEEIKNDPYLKDVNELRRLTNEYIKKYPYTTFVQSKTKRVGSYIRESDWFESLTTTRKENIDYVLRNLDSYTYKYSTIDGVFEAVQCIGWTALLANLGYENSPTDISSHSVSYARELIPKQLLEQTWRNEMTIGGCKYVAPNNLSEIEAGDLFITYELPFENSVGHIGAVIGKKNKGNETILLLSDANRICDGASRIFKVDNANAHGIFGKPPKRWVVLRKRHDKE